MTNKHKHRADGPERCSLCRYMTGAADAAELDRGAFERFVAGHPKVEDTSELRVMLYIHSSPQSRRAQDFKFAASGSEVYRRLRTTDDWNDLGTIPMVREKYRLRVRPARGWKLLERSSQS